MPRCPASRARLRCPTAWMSRLWPLNWKAEERPTTRKFGTLASAEAISSVMPSEKNSWSLSEDRFANGSTTTAMPPTSGVGAVVATLGLLLGCSCPVDGASCWYDTRAITTTSGSNQTDDARRIGHSGRISAFLRGLMRMICTTSAPPVGLLSCQSWSMRERMIVRELDI